MDIVARCGLAPGRVFGRTGGIATGLSFLVETAVRAIESRLDERGLFNDVTHDELREISDILKRLPALQANEVVSRLSDAGLVSWMDEIASSGWFGTGGLSADERRALFGDLAAKLEPEQMARLYNASGDNELRAELMETVSRRWTVEGIETAAKARLDTLSPGAGGTELQEAVTRLNQLQHHTLMARLSDDVYLSPVESSGAFLAGGRLLPRGVTRMGPGELLAELGIRKEQLVDDKSGFHAALYKVEQRGVTRYVVAFRGTEDGRDWKTNVASLSRLTDQEKMAAKLVDAVLKKVGGSNVSLTGHSLGGGLANFAGLLHGVPSVTFNAKGITNPEIQAIRSAHPGVDIAARANGLLVNYQVDGEVLTSAQRHAPLISGALGAAVGGFLLGGVTAVKVDQVVHEAPGTAIETPAIRPDGKEGNMLLEAAAKVAALPNIDISGPLDRHGMDYVLRGMAHMNEAAGQQLLQALFGSYSTGRSVFPGRTN